MRNVKRYGLMVTGLCIGLVVVSELVPARENEEIKELQITQSDVELLNRIRQCRPADLSDAMDAVGLVGIGSMSPEMRPIRIWRPGKQPTVLKSIGILLTGLRKQKARYCDVMTSIGTKRSSYCTINLKRCPAKDRS
jgi:hypothetical protein